MSGPALTRRGLAGIGLAGIGLGAAGASMIGSGALAQAGAPGRAPGTLTAAPTSQSGLGPRLTMHAIDNFHGTPGAGMTCELSVREGDAYRPLKTVVTAASGRTADPLLIDDAVKVGQYELLMHIGEYFAKIGVGLPSPSFLDRVPIRFRIRDAGQRTHLPVLFTPWGYSYYRGS